MFVAARLRLSASLKFSSKWGSGYCVWRGRGGWERGGSAAQKLANKYLGLSPASNYTYGVMDSPDNVGEAGRWLGGVGNTGSES